MNSRGHGGRVSDVRDGKDGLRREHGVRGMNDSLEVPAAPWGPVELGVKGA